MSAAALLLPIAVFAGGEIMTAMSSSAAGQWISLFNGRNLDGWTVKIRTLPLGEDDRGTFRVKDGLLKVSYDRYDTFDSRYGHLFYHRPYSHYRLRAQYRFVGEQIAGGRDWAYRNSGVMIHSQSPHSMGIDQYFPVSIEVQLLGDDGTGQRPTANLCTPGTHVVMAGRLHTEHCVNAAAPAAHHDQWVTVEIEVRGGQRIRHFVNGALVLEYQHPQLDPEDEDAGPLIGQGNLSIAGGYIAIQSESAPVEFRRIDLLPLSLEHHD